MSTYLEGEAAVGVVHNLVEVVVEVEVVEHPFLGSIL